VEALSQPAHHRFAVRQEEDAGALRRAVGALARSRSGIRSGEAELVATELATNLVKHATAGGYVLYRPLDAGIELVAVDSGPGMRNVREWRSWAGDAADPGPALHRDGLGAGLVTVQRLASTFDVYSRRDAGTVVLARLGVGGPAGSQAFGWGAVSVPQDGEVESGDGCAVAADGWLAALVVDGLGHGPSAYAASRAAIAAFGERPEADVADLVRRAHVAMRGTRGGVVAVCRIDPGAGELTYAGVGNIAGRLFLGGDEWGLVSREGMLGTHLPAPAIRPGRHPWGPGATLVLASDGLRSHWDRHAHPGLFERDPVVAAATLHRDFARGHDDALVLVIRDSRSAAP
jgi:anti-sigma regulatory factor (Ser/Thr protein kinase)